MKPETIQALFTYLTAYTIVVGGLIFLYAVRADVTAADLKVVVGGFIGAAITFVFNTAAANRATSAAMAATAIGTGTTVNTPNATVTGSPVSVGEK